MTLAVGKAKAVLQVPVLHGRVEKGREGSRRVEKGRDGSRSWTTEC